MHVDVFRVQSQLRSLAAGLEAHGGGVGDSHRGAGWEGWVEESGALSPEGTQARAASYMELGGHSYTEALFSFLMLPRYVYLSSLLLRPIYIFY